MKVARVGIIAIAVLAVATVASAQKPDFSGTWTLDAAEGGGGGGRGGRGGVLGAGPTTVKQTATDLVVESTMASGNKVTRTYKLDGTESKNTVMGRGGNQMEQVSTAKWDGNKLTIVTKSQFNDQTFETTEVWDVSGSTLTVESTSARGTTKRVYKK